MRKALALIAIAIGAMVLFGEDESGNAAQKPQRPAVAVTSAETYRLVHAIGNDENISARGLTLGRCQSLREEKRTVVKALGVGGSVTCLPESSFR